VKSKINNQDKRITIFDCRYYTCNTGISVEGWSVEKTFFFFIPFFLPYNFSGVVLECPMIPIINDVIYRKMSNVKMVNDQVGRHRKDVKEISSITY
jgi:hypothetical protein